MTAAAATHDFPAYEPQMKGPVAFSAILHTLFVVIAIVGLPYLKPELPIVDTSITVELMSAEEMNDIHKPIDSPRKPVEPEQKKDEPPKPVMPTVTAETPPKPVAPAPPEEKDDMAPPEKDAPEPLKKPEQAKPKTPAKKPTPVLTKTEDPPQEEQFKSLLRNLMPTEEDPAKADARKGEQATQESGRPMSMGETNALQAQLTQCWRLMAGARYAEDLIVDLTLYMNPDRTVRDAKIENVLRYNADTFFRAAADSARSAVYRCSPLDLPPNKYDQWKVLPVRFDPRSML